MKHFFLSLKNRSSHNMVITKILTLYHNIEKNHYMHYFKWSTEMTSWKIWNKNFLFSFFVNSFPENRLLKKRRKTFFDICNPHLFCEGVIINVFHPNFLLFLLKFSVSNLSVSAELGSIFLIHHQLDFDSSINFGILQHIIRLIRKKKIR